MQASSLRFGWNITTNNDYLERVIDSMKAKPELCPPGFGEVDGRDFFLNVSLAAGSSPVRLLENPVFRIPSMPSVGVPRGTIHYDGFYNQIPMMLHEAAPWLSGLLKTALNQSVKIPKDGTALSEQQMLRVAKALKADIPKMEAENQRASQAIDEAKDRLGVSFDELPACAPFFADLKEFPYSYSFQPASNNDDWLGLDVGNRHQLNTGEPGSLFTVYCPESNFSPEGILIVPLHVRPGESTPYSHSYTGGKAVQPTSPELRQALFDLMCETFRHDEYRSKFVPDASASS